MGRLTEAGIHLIYGPMFAGKTSRAMSIAREYAAIGMKVMFANSSKDTRSSEGEGFSSHNETLKMGKCIASVVVKNLSSVTSVSKKFDVIFIDEAQFFSDLYKSVMTMVEEHKKIVIVSGLDLDFDRKQFGQIIDLVSHADIIERLYPLCMPCGSKGIAKDAMYSKLITIHKGDNNILIGGKDKYMAVCRNCYISGREKRAEK